MSNKFIYRCSWVESKRHKRPHTSVYFQMAEHTEWVFNEPCFADLVKVEYIKVDANSEQYRMAVETSNIHLWKVKQEQLMKEFEMHRIMECVVCYETVKNCISCTTCKKGTCFKCCVEYSITNFGKFPFRHDPTDEVGCGMEVLLPCPTCRTDNLFMY